MGDSRSARSDLNLGTDINPAIPRLVLDCDTGPIAVGEDTAKLTVETRLVCVAGPDLGRTFPVGSIAIIGRGAATVNLQATNVSRSHARISMLGEQFFIEDLDSANGTHVNGVTITAKTELHFGDRVQAGSTILVFTRHDQLEARMRQMQRLEAMASLAGGLAHDFNNMLTIILGGLDELDYRFAKDSDEHVRETFEGMRSAVTAGAVLARRLLNLGRTEPVALDRLDLASVIEKTLAMAHQLVGSRIRLSAKVRPDVIVRGCQDELQQVLLNLVMNARDAMPDGGRLMIAVQLVHLDHSGALMRHLPNEGDYVELAITDTGIGMDEATLARAFEPFFTTKGPDKGTGLGLATIHAIVRRHGGTVLAESIPHQGTTFRVLLPKAT